MLFSPALFFLLLSVLCAGVLLVWLRRPGQARGLTIWALAALLPLLTAVTVALRQTP